MQIQSSNIAFPGFSDEATWLTCGYVLNGLETEIEQYALTCAVGSEIRFVLPITVGSVDNVEPLPVERISRKAKVLPQRKLVTKQAKAINERVAD